MEPISWSIIAQLIISEGIPLAVAIGKKWMSGNPPTPKDFDELLALTAETSTDEANKVIASLGLTPDDPKAKMILDLVK